MKKHITALDGLRGVAVILVLFRHLLPHHHVAAFLPRLVNGIAGVGWSGVDIFFTLSGFLITGILYDAKGHPFYFRNFYMRRTLRILPLYFAVVACCVLVFPHFWITRGSAPPVHTWMYWTFLSNLPFSFHGAVPHGWLGSFWSLAVEEHFYLLWPTVILLCSRRTGLNVCIGCVFLANAARLWFVAHHNLFAPYFFTLCRIDELAMGAWLALTLRDKSETAMLQRFAAPVAVIAGVVACVLFGWRDGVALDPIMMSVGMPAIAFSCAALLALAVLPDTATTWKRVLQSTVLRQFGLYSYGLYLLHVPISEFMYQNHLLFAFPGFSADLLNFLAMTAVSCVAAFFSFHAFEKHFLRLKRYFPADGNAARERRAARLPDTRPRQLSVETR